ncbi:hypothetical protein O181_011665 [Austropuccinia psidii MF-1]|uniref:Uncharacterized protein n=1 Tax=Austropuccinia psidii MF-1 TaxID=1389203 RepID=A0A9Q3BVK6_9BASI|nr:hypothetical protein [Austropuccinia psidii MF-1]
MCSNMPPADHKDERSRRMVKARSPLSVVVEKMFATNSVLCLRLAFPTARLTITRDWDNISTECSIMYSTELEREHYDVILI